MVYEEELLVISEAARTLGYTVQHTRLLIRQGKLQGTKKGRDWVVSREAVADYNIRKASIPLLPTSSKRGRPSTADKAKLHHYSASGVIGR